MREMPHEIKAWRSPAARCRTEGVWSETAYPVDAVTYVHREFLTSVLASTFSRAALDVLAERQRQIGEEGWTPEHDDMHGSGELAGAAACYAMQAILDGIGARHLGDTVKHTIRELWPWAQHWWKPTTRRRDLVKAAALLIAEIERLDRK